MLNTNQEIKSPPWMNMDTRPMDKGEWQEWGFGYSRTVDPKHELWRPATRVILRRDNGKFKSYEIVQLRPGSYFVSDHGRIYSIWYHKLISSDHKHKRHNTVTLAKATGDYIQASRYRVVISNWIEPPPHIRNLVYTVADTVNHINGNEWDDRICNLQYTTRGYNTIHGRDVIAPIKEQRKKEREEKRKQKQEVIS